MARAARPFAAYLVAPRAYWHAPPEIKARLCNGAGPAHLPSWVVPDTIYGVSITEAANIHDWMYVWGTTPRDKEDADATFLLNMLRICHEHTTTVWPLSWLMNMLRHRRALKYYEAVQAFGDTAFKDARKARPDPAVYTNPDLEPTGYGPGGAV